MKKPGIRRLAGGKLSINLIRVREEIEAGTFSEEDRRTLERSLPGIYAKMGLEVRTSPKAANGAEGVKP